jgi:hypothetical protein
MIVLKATQDKVLGVLQSVAAILERRHTLPMLANVLLRKSGAIVSGPTNAPVASYLIVCRQPLSPVSGREDFGLVFSSAQGGFFSANKASLRNAP